MKILIGDGAVDMTESELRDHNLRIYRGELNTDGTPKRPSLSDSSVRVPNPSVEWGKIHPDSLPK